MATENNHFEDNKQEPLEDYEEPIERSLHEKSTQTKGSYAGKQTIGFRDFLLHTKILRAIGDFGFEHPSEVQQSCIPFAAFGTDIICQAKSGMGKTAVFVISVLQQISPNTPHVDTLVLCNTRELAYQISQEFDRFSKYIDGVTTMVLFGGISEAEHSRLLESKKPNIIVGTPGRVLALLNQKKLDLSHLKRFILDECDKMLSSLDMRDDVQKIFTSTPHEKQVLMFSATIDDTNKEVCRRFARNPREIFVDNDANLTLHGLQQYYTRIKETSKTAKILDLLDSLDFNQVLIFVNSKKRANALNKILVSSAFPSTVMHGGLNQNLRIGTYLDMKSYRIRILVTTDLCCRGIDAESVNVVINYDMPEDDDTYLHRVGRAGRFGTKGLGISFVTTNIDLEVLQKVQKRFEVKISDLPDKVDSSFYMSAA